jgi:hypothetical protein
MCWIPSNLFVQWLRQPEREADRLLTCRVENPLPGHTHYNGSMCCTSLVLGTFYQISWFVCWVKRVRNVGSATFIVGTWGGVGWGRSAERATDAQTAACSVMLEKGCTRERPTYRTQIKGNLSLNRGTRSWPTNIWQRSWTETKKLLRNLLYSPEMQFSQRVCIAARSHVCRLDTCINRWMYCIQQIT